MTTDWQHQTCSEERLPEGAHMRLDSTEPAPAERSGDSGTRTATDQADCGLAAGGQGPGCRRWLASQGFLVPVRRRPGCPRVP